MDGSLFIIIILMSCIEFYQQIGKLRCVYFLTSNLCVIHINVRLRILYIQIMLISHIATSKVIIVRCKMYIAFYATVHNRRHRQREVENRIISLACFGKGHRQIRKNRCYYKNIIKFVIMVDYIGNKLSQQVVIDYSINKKNCK